MLHLFVTDPYFSTRPIILSRSHLDGARYSNSSSDVFIPLNIHQSRLAVEAVRAPRIYRVCSQGREWTSNHWNKVKNIGEFYCGNNLFRNLILIQKSFSGLVSVALEVLLSKGD